ncbi:hypothetical protein ACS0TY_012683 [Phlomoides rotata]
MTSMKLNIEKFIGKNYFGLWKIKMKALLTHNGLAVALKVTTRETSSSDGEKMYGIQEKAHSIFLCLGDRVLSEVSRETTIVGVWKKFEDLYLLLNLFQIDSI